MDNQNPRIFLCHASNDKARVRLLYHNLCEVGLNPWLDEENLLPGQDWAQEIKNAIKSSDYFLVCLSKSSVDKRGYFQKEIKMALDVLDEIPEGKVFLIPVRLDDCEVPDRLRDRQWIDFDTRGVTRLLMTIANQHPHLANQLRIDFSKPAQGFNQRLKVDYDKLHSLLMKSDWWSANNETRKILLYLAGKDAANRGNLSEEEDINNIPCAALQKIKQIWETQGKQGLRKLFPYVYVPRKAELESPLFIEMRNWKTQIENCNIKEFMWYKRPDGEILHGSKDWFKAEFAKLLDTAPIAADILRFSSLFITWHFYPIFLKLLVKAFPNFESSHAHTANDDKYIESLIIASIERLESQFLIFNVEKASFCNHNFVQDCTLNTMDDTTLRRWKSRAIRAVNSIFPDPDDKSNWPPDKNVAMHAITGWRHSLWKNEWECEIGASLLMKVGVYLMKEETRIGHEDDAKRVLIEALRIFNAEKGNNDSMIKRTQYYLNLVDKTNK